MGAGAEVAVVDAGPLIHLAEIAASYTLNVFGGLHLPQAVWAETVEQRRISAASLTQLPITRHTLIPFEVTQFSQMQALTALHLGEQECLFVTIDIVEMAIQQLRAAHD